MDLKLADSKILQNIILDSLKRSVGEDGADHIYANLRLNDERANNLFRSMNGLIIKSGYGLKIKEIFEKLGDELASRVDVRVEPNSASLVKDGSQNIFVEITNRFDVPLLFDVTLEDRDNFLPVIFNRNEQGYFNNYSSEAVIDTGDIGRFKFRVGWEGNTKAAGTGLFLIVRSKDIEGLNKIEKIKLEFIKS